MAGAPCLLLGGVCVYSEGVAGAHGTRFALGSLFGAAHDWGAWARCHFNSEVFMQFMAWEYGALLCFWGSCFRLRYWTRLPSLTIALLIRRFGSWHDLLLSIYNTDLTRIKINKNNDMLLLTACGRLE